jgi:malate dehydrogenase
MVTMGYPRMAPMSRPAPIAWAADPNWRDWMKVTVVGSGFVGATTAMRVAQQGLADEVVMVDIVEGLPQGLALDMNQSAPVEGFEPVVRGTNEYADTSGSDVVVITAGVPRQPGMSRMDLLGKNAGIIRDVAGNVGRTSPQAILVVVSNPLDEMAFLTAEVTGFPRARVMGMAGTLDSARLRTFIAAELGVSPSAVEAMTLGSHGDSMVPLPGRATVEGKPLRDLVDDETLERLYQRTRDAGAEIVGYLKKGSAYYAPSASVAQMVHAIVADNKDVLPACVWATGQYGISDVFVGLPARLGRGGVEDVVELDLAPDELSALRQAAEGIRSRCADLGSL